MSWVRVSSGAKNVLGELEGFLSVSFLLDGVVVPRFGTRQRPTHMKNRHDDIPTLSKIKFEATDVKEEESDSEDSVEKSVVGPSRINRQRGKKSVNREKNRSTCQKFYV
ncbi:hypothetical protein R6Q59_021940 [Mikania micrantha]